MKQYICCKRVHAEPMTRGEFSKYQGRKLRKGEDAEDPGYLVVYNKDSSRHYESWYPADAFEDGYVAVQEVI